MYRAYPDILHYPTFGVVDMPADLPRIEQLFHVHINIYSYSPEHHAAVTHYSSLSATAFPDPSSNLHSDG